MSPEEQGTGPSSAQGTTAMAWSQTEPSPWQIFAFSAAQEVKCGQCWDKEPGFALHFCIRVWGDSVPRCLGVCCAATRCPLTTRMEPCLCFVPQKSTPPGVKGFSPAEHTLQSLEGHLVWFREAKPSPRAVLSRDCHFCTTWAPVCWLGSFKHSPAVPEPGAQQELQWPAGLTSWKPARPACSSCHKCLWPISNIYVVQDHINSTN